MALPVEGVDACIQDLIELTEDYKQLEVISLPKSPISMFETDGDIKIFRLK